MMSLLNDCPGVSLDAPRLTARQAQILALI